MPGLMSWWGTATNRAKVWTIFISLGATTCGLIVGLPAAWSTVGLPVFVTHDYLVAQLNEFKRDQAETKRLLFEIRRGQVDREVFDLERRTNRSADDDFRLHQLHNELQRIDTTVR